MSTEIRDFRLSQAGCSQAVMHTKAGSQGSPLGLGHGIRPGKGSLLVDAFFEKQQLGSSSSRVLRGGIR